MSHGADSGAAHTPGEAVVDFIGGCMGGTASVYVGQPLDTVKVKMQTFSHLYRSSLHCFVRTYRQDGVARGLYAGTLPSLAAQVSENAVLFLFYGVCQKLVLRATPLDDVTQLTALHNAVAGGCAAFFSSFPLCTTELIKCKLQAMREMRDSGQLSGEQSRQLDHIGPWRLTKQVFREEGVVGLFRGLVPTFMREIPGYFFFFGGYEVARALLTPPGKTKDEIGVTALYKGLGPGLLRTFPATGALFLAYETTKKVGGRLLGKDTQ